MSYDLTIRADRQHSGTTARAPLAAFIAQLPGIRPNGSSFVLDVPPKRWMEIDLELVSEDGDNIEESDGTCEVINCIRLHIPAGFQGGSIGRAYFPTALAIAQRVGWMLLDEQTGEAISPGASIRKKPWWKLW